MSATPEAVDASLPRELAEAVAARLEAADDQGVVSRIWEHDETLWGGPGPEIGNRLGWLDIADRQLETADDLVAFADLARQEGFTHAALLGMGGSSLGPEVIRRSYGDQGALKLHVLDSTHPDAVRALEAAIDLERTIFIVSSKSGGTLETLSHMRHFYGLSGGNGSQFVAVTDPGSGLVSMAAEHGFRRVFENDADIGGRYSVLSYFGLVPAALMGVDIRGLLGSAQEAADGCRAAEENIGLWTGVALGELARLGRDKATFVVSPRIASFGPWVEQLVAESTGKDGTGILPVADEPLGDPAAYGDDRVFVYLRDDEQPDSALETAVEGLREAGQPVITLGACGAKDLGRVFFTFEFAVAVAGWVLGINPFDQPDVQEAKDNTKAVLEASEPPRIEDADDSGLSALVSEAAPPRYVAVMGYVAPSEELDAAALELRAAIRDSTRAATTFGYGPRFLHSTGQFHKGGPPVGIFLQLVNEVGEDIDVPDAGFGFGELIEAQAAGDVLTLRDHGLPVERLRLEGSDPAAALRAVTEKVRVILAD
ncbi:MAG: glucose-6-phosphate isomerase [Thermoleophilaceae bacterium]